MSVGIYRIENLVNHKSYIGKSKYLEDRIAQFYDGDHRNVHLDNSVQKYGIESFKVTILEECTVEELNDKERYWISYLRTYDPSTGYNKTFGGDGGSPTEETRKKLCLSHIGNKSWRGLTHTELQKRKIGESCRRWHKEVGFSEESRKKMSDNLSGEKNGMFQRVQVRNHETGESTTVSKEDLTRFLEDNPDFVVGNTGRVWVSLLDNSGNVLDQKLTLTPDIYLEKGYVLGMKKSGRLGLKRGSYKSSTL